MKRNANTWMADGNIHHIIIKHDSGRLNLILKLLVDIPNIHTVIMKAKGHER